MLAARCIQQRWLLDSAPVRPYRHVSIKEPKLGVKVSFVTAAACRMDARRVNWNTVSPGALPAGA